MKPIEDHFLARSRWALPLLVYGLVWIGGVFTGISIGIALW